MNIAILTPTRSRPRRRAEFHNSVISLADSVVSMYYYIDEDDPELETYQEAPLGNQIVGPAISVSKSWNDLARVAIEKGADILIMGNDDLIYKTKGWDSILKKIIRKEFPDNIYCIWFQDGINGHSHCAFPVVSKEWVQCLGYFTPGIFNFGYNDTWIFEIGKLINRTRYIPEIETKHLHYTVDKSLWDTTYGRNRSEEKGNLYVKDSEIFSEFKNVRIEDAKKLNTYMGVEE